MSVLTVEATVENGAIRLLSPIQLPDRAIVYVVIPDVQVVASEEISMPRQTTHIYSPRMRNRLETSAFDLVEVMRATDDEI